MKKDYHRILGVKPGATEKEIRSAYKRLAKKYHPDVNPGDKRAEEKFKEIGEAHDVLTDPEKRRKWEAGDFDFESFMRGRGGAGPAGSTRTYTFTGAADGDLGDLLGDLFGAVGGGRGRSRGAGMRARVRGPDLEYEARLTFEEAVRGTTLRVPLEHAEVQVRVRPGTEDGARMRVPGKGAPGPGDGPPGDLYVRLHVEPHPYFRRDGQDIVLDLPLTVAEATLGTKVEVPTIDGGVTLTVPPGSNSGQRLRLKGRGVPAPHGGARGDQIVVLQIVTPKGLDQAARRALEEMDRRFPADPRARLGW